MTKMTIDLAAAKRFLEGVPMPVLAAVSGGLDSMCLLHLLATWGKENHVAVTAAHFNHQLRGEAADRDEAFVKKVCEEWGIPCVCGRGDTRACAEQEGFSIEEAARNLRYDFLEQTRRQTGCATILTAHHADDNAETMLLNLIRGTGIRGLTGIPPFRDGIARPFLQVTRAELAAYAEANRIPHVEDETNELDEAARNVLRHKVLPVLKELNPRAVENMTRTAELLARDERALELQTGRLLREVKADETSARLPLGVCEQQPRGILGRVVLSMMAQVCGHQKDLTAAHVEAALELLHGAPGREVSLPYGMRARRMKDCLRITAAESVENEIPIHPGESVNWGRWTVTLGDIPAECGELKVTAWKPSDRMTLPGSRGARSLKRLCADAGISPEERDTMPVLRCGEQVVAAPGIGSDLKFLPQAESAAVYVTFHYNKDIEESHYEK